MSYTNTTTHFQWPLPEETDLFNGLDDNQMKEELDEKIYNLEQRSTGDHEAVEALTGRVTQVEQTVGGYDEQIEQLEGTVSEHAERLVNLTNRQTELSRRLNGKAGESTIAPEYNEEESYSVGDFVYHNNILYKAVNASATPAGTFDADDWDIVILTDELGGSTPGTIAAANVSFDDVIAQLGANNVQGAIVALKSLIDNIGGVNMKCAMFGVATGLKSGAPSTIDISQLNLSSEEDYMVILGGDGPIDYQQSCYISAKTATSFTITAEGSASGTGIKVGYQVITFN